MFEEDNMIISPKDWTSSEEIIKVIGVGGGGCNAVSYMFRQGIEGCSFIVCNTDSQALSCSPVPCQIQMGPGLGAGTNPIKGRNAALESQDEIERKVMDSNTKMLFITAGMGGGTGTGAAPVIAKMAKDKGILTVGVVTLPFCNEGNKARTRAVDGIRDMEKCREMAALPPAVIAAVPPAVISQLGEVLIQKQGWCLWILNIWRTLRADLLSV